LQLPLPPPLPRSFPAVRLNDQVLPNSCKQQSSSLNLPDYSQIGLHQTSPALTLLTSAWQHLTDSEPVPIETSFALPVLLLHASLFLNEKQTLPFQSPPTSFPLLLLADRGLLPM